MLKYLTVAILLLTFVLCGYGQVAQEKVDTAAISKIKDEGFNRSQVMDLLSTLSDVYGPRLTGSPGFRRAADWAKQTLGSWGLENAHLEAWGPFGRGWSLKHYSAQVIAPQDLPLIAYPKAWSPSVKVMSEMPSMPVAKGKKPAAPMTAPQPSSTVTAD